MKLSEILDPVVMQHYADMLNKRQDARRVVVNYRNNMIPRQMAKRSLERLGFSPRQVDTLLGPDFDVKEAHTMDDDYGGHDVISSPKLMRILMDLHGLVQKWSQPVPQDPLGSNISRGMRQQQEEVRRQAARELQDVMRKHGLSEAQILRLIK